MNPNEKFLNYRLDVGIRIFTELNLNMKLLSETLTMQVQLGNLLLKNAFQDRQELQQIWQVEGTLGNSMPELSLIENQEDEQPTWQMDETKQEFIDLGDGLIDKDIETDYPTTSNPSDEYSNGKYDVKSENGNDEKDDKEMVQMVNHCLMKCRNCGKSYRYRGSYVKHLENCGKHLRTVIALNKHKLVHPEDRPFQCDVCQTSFKTKAVLKVHHQIHEESHFECDICGKRLKTRRTWNLHKMLHK